MAKKKDFLTSVSDLLPEGLDESTLEQIASLISRKIDEQVKASVNDLTTKVTSFIRGNIEKLKEQAIKELELENPVFRNAQLFETVRSIFAFENTGEDEINGMAALAEISEGQEQKIDVLVSELDKLLKENVSLKRSAKILSDKNERLEESLVSLKENFNVTSGKTQTKHMSDSAIIVSGDNFKVRESEQKQEKANVNGNEWLNESILTASKKLIKG